MDERHPMPPQDSERERRWRLAVGVDDEQASGLSEQDQRISAALSALYGDGDPRADSRRRPGGLGRSAPRVAQWIGDIRKYFPTPVVQIIQKDAFERLDLKQMLMEPELLQAIEADVNLIADLVSLRSVMPSKTKDMARQVIAGIVATLMERLERRTADAIRGALNRARRTRRPRPRDIDWPRTIAANLRHYQPQHGTIVPEHLVGFMRTQRRIADLDEVVLCVDQSGSMASSVVYASIFASVIASLPVVQTRLVCFDTAVVDLTGELSDPVEVLFGVQLGGGTDINRAVAYCADRIERPSKTHFILITDLFEGGDGTQLLQRLNALVRAGVNVIVLLALTDQGRPGYDPQMAGAVAALGVPVFTCTPELFPDLMAAALRREDIGQWAAAVDIKVVRAEPLAAPLLTTDIPPAI
jgi:Mg-chelatase subunit ChlD